MLRLSYLIFIVTIAVAVGLSMSFIDHYEEPSYVGSRSCATCHSSRSSQLIYQKWKAGPHSQASARLKDSTAVEFLQKHPELKSSCLTCHTTLGREPHSPKENEIDAEGVGCERCHGPGSLYMPLVVMNDPKEFASHGGSRGSLEDCYGCHRSPSGPNTAPHCPFDTSSFNAEVQWSLIGHSRTDSNTRK